MINRESFQIANRPIGRGHPCFVIAEIAQAHDGSLGLAHAFIDAAAEAGADAVKFQTHIAEVESTLDEPFRVHFSCQDKTRYDYWHRIEFTAEEWGDLAEHARRRGLIFLSSAFSLLAVDILQRLGMPAWKVAAGEFRSIALLDAMAATGAPMLFSTGMMSWGEIGETVSWLRAKAIKHALLQCTSAYPAPLEQVGLNVLDRLREQYECPVGLSDHSGSLFPGLSAMARGANIIEVHVTFHRAMFGPDTAASVTFEELKLMCGMRDALTVMHAHPVDKDSMAKSLAEVRETFGRSVAPARALSAGTVLRREMLMLKKPGGGIPPESECEVIGRRLARDVGPTQILRWADLAEERL